VAVKKGNGPKARGTLSRQLILRTALRVIDAEGMEALSMRRLAAELGVFPTALYHHVENKDALLRGVVALALAEVELAGQDGNSAGRAWADRLRALGRAFRRLAGAHPRLFPHLVFFPEATLEEYGVYEALYRILEDAGLSPAAVVRASTLVFAYATGFTLAEVSGTLGPLTHAERDDLAALPPGRFPTTHRLMGRLAAVDLDADFEFGLDVIVSGLAAMAAGPTTRG
jgi:AcrR family transcriptional regulator